MAGSHIPLIIICLIVLSNPVISSSIVESLPGFPGSLPFKLETRYIAVDENEDVEYFYYFVESEGNPRDDPLMLWFTGGPGCSGLSGLVFEIGPIMFNVVEYNGSLPSLILNPHSWTKINYVLCESITNFIGLEYNIYDAPAGTGFSYAKSSQGLENGDLVFANQSFTFLRKAETRSMIVPLVAEEIAKSIEANNNIPKLNFKGYLLGNPSTNPKFDANSKVPFAHRMRLISDQLYESVKKNCKIGYRGNRDNVPCAKDLEAVGRCTENLNSLHILDPLCRSIFPSNFKNNGNRKSLLEKLSQPGRKPSLIFPDLPPEYPEFGCRDYQDLLVYFWANDKDVQRALRIKKGTLKRWIRCNSDIPYLKQLESVIAYHKRLNSRQLYRALIYSGDHDMVVTYVGTQAWIKTLKLPIVSEWRPWLVDDQVAGYVTEYANNFTFSTIKGGGHTVPSYQPKECFAMFQRWISNIPF